MEKYTHCRYCNGPLEFTPLNGEKYFTATCRREECSGSDMHTRADPQDVGVLLDTLSQILSGLSVKCVMCADVDPFRCSWCKGALGSWERDHDYSIGEVAERIEKMLYSVEQQALFTPMGLRRSNTYDLHWMPPAKAADTFTPAPFTLNPTKIGSHSASWSSSEVTWQVPTYRDTRVHSKPDGRDFVEVSDEELRLRGIVIRGSNVPASWRYNPDKMTWMIPAKDYEQL